MKVGFLQAQIRWQILFFSFFGISLHSSEKPQEEGSIPEERQETRASPVHSGLYSVPGFKIKRGGIGFINGIYTSLEVAHLHATRISHYAGGARVTYVHNATHSLVVDVSECLLGYLRIPTPPVLLLLKQWEEFDQEYPPDAKFLQIAHSQGTIHVKNALLAASPSLRDRIIVLAIAPAALISSDLCYEAYNYVSENDFVPYFDVIGTRHHKEELILLEAHPQAHWFDHLFESPTYAEILELSIREYLSVYQDD